MDMQMPDLVFLIPYATAALKAFATLIVGFMIAGWVRGLAYRGLERAKIDLALAKFLSSIARYIIIAATFIAAAEAVGIKTTSLMAIFASAGLAVGLALQGSLSSFASGVMILFFRPFTIGDAITADGTTGVVMEIGLFATSLSLPNGTMVIIPNNAVTANTIYNHTHTGARRTSIDIGVAYGTDMEQVRGILLAAAEGVDGVMTDPGPAAAFVSFGGSSLDWQVHIWTPATDWVPVSEQVRIAIYNGLLAADIEIPFPKMDVTWLNKDA